MDSGKKYSRSFKHLSYYNIFLFEFLEGKNSDQLLKIHAK